MDRSIIIHKNDNVAVALSPLFAQEHLVINEIPLQLLNYVPVGHKFALQRIEKGSAVIKYGHVIGVARSTILPGEWVHTHNLTSQLKSHLTYEYEPTSLALDKQVLLKPIPKQQTFKGFVRSNQSVGVRNELWIIPTVGCLNSVIRSLEKKSASLIKGSISEVVAFPHPYGCSQLGEDQESTRRILADLILHPNAGGVLVMGLGCENSNIDVLKNYLGDYDKQRIRFLVASQSQDEITDGLKLLEELADLAKDDKRISVSVDKLVIGLKCGGSDGLSGITANPTVGAFSDLLLSAGGTSILTEVPEMFGAEQTLMNRCLTLSLFKKTVQMIEEFKAYYTSLRTPIDENPSPGNKEGGISTLEDKSLGCTQKSGTFPVCDVLSYGDRVITPGLNLLSGPGNDLVASTALACAGAQLILFTTGRGTPFASPVPTIKLSSNSALAQLKSNWIDFDCGSIVLGKPINELANELYDYVLSVASGEAVCSETNGYHDMAIFKTGVTL